MAPKPHIPDGWRARLIFTTTGGAFVGMPSFGVNKEGLTWSQAVIDDLSGIVGAAVLSNNVNDAWGDVFTFSSMQWTNYDQPTRADIVSSTGIPGVETGDPLPSNVAVITSFRTPFAGPRFRGRSYWPCYTEPSSDGNILNSTTQTNLQAFWEDVITGFAAYSTGCELAVLSAAALAATEVTSVIVEGIFATQRRRLSRARRGS